MDEPERRAPEDSPEPRGAVKDITRLIDKIEAGGERVADELLEAVYTELRKLAAARVARSPGVSIQATDLVHEAYLRLLRSDDESWNGRAHFFGAAAEAMRRVLIDRMRSRSALRRGGDRERDPLDSCVAANEPEHEELEELNVALDRLEQEDPTKAALVKLRYFVGLTIPQVADALGISRATADRYWSYSRARLFQWIRHDRGE